jgi:predicted GIY-YIG superfamily endonuclease
MPACRYFVYVVLLSPEVLRQVKFSKANAAYKVGEPCVYVGMTGLDLDTRFDKHKAGVQANGYVQKYGLRLMPELVDDLKQPMTYKDAQYLEVEVGIKLKERGYGVWQA